MMNFKQFQSLNQPHISNDLLTEAEPPLPSGRVEPEQRKHVVILNTGEYDNGKRATLAFSAILKPVIIAATLALMSGCATGILKVDQDRYDDGTALQFLQGSTILGPPGRSGLPEGDRFGLVVPPAFVTDDTPGDLGRAVRIGDRIEFNTDTEHTVPDRYQIVWTGVRSSVGQAVTSIVLRDDAGDEALRVRYQLNEIDVIWGDDVGPGPAFLSQIPHEVRITLHMNGASAAGDVTITQDNNVILDQRNLDLIDREFSRLDVIDVRTQTDYHMKDLIAIAQKD